MDRSPNKERPLGSPTDLHKEVRCSCVKGNQVLDAGVYPVRECDQRADLKCAINPASRCPPGFQSRADCKTPSRSWPDGLYNTDNYVKPSFYRWNHYLAYVGTPARVGRDVYAGDGNRFPTY